jgi:protein TonB
MFKSSDREINRRFPASPEVRSLHDRTQRRMMVIALSLLLFALGFVLYRDRDFWFPNTQEAQEVEDQSQPVATAPGTSNTATAARGAKSAQTVHKKSAPGKAQPNVSSPDASSPTSSPASSPGDSAPADASAPGMTATTTRTVLPPLEVEVVAGDVHRTVHPGTNSVRVDLQPGSPAQKIEVPAAAPAPDAAARVTSNAAERVQMSADAAQVVSRPVEPGYPLLARQMKVQGSVILQALIGRDGLIQDLRVLSGPPILANAAQEAVKQWHFKPHYQGADAVETQAKITVNFTISTN